MHFKFKKIAANNSLKSYFGKIFFCPNLCPENSRIYLCHGGTKIIACALLTKIGSAVSQLGKKNFEGAFKIKIYTKKIVNQ